MAIKIVKTQAELDLLKAQWKTDSQSIAFVPTMGALHAGHLHLIRTATNYAQKVVCSIFVNPTQFNDRADFDRYPRNVDADAVQLNNTPCDVLFVPSVEEVYDHENIQKQQFDFGALAQVMEGAHRQGHFNGVGMVVKRLFEMVEPQVALFGLKDYQQYCIVKELVRQYNIPVNIIGVDTQREPDGLAMSSRNTLLDPLHRELAPVIYEVLQEAKAQVGQLPVNNLKLLVEQRLLQLPDVKVDYVEIADSTTLQPVTEIKPGVQVRMFVAAFFGKIRLIDNIALN